jgi:SRSO17 transposase
MAQCYLAGGIERAACFPLRRRSRAPHRAALQVTPPPHPVEWLLVEWPEGEAAPTKYWLSTLPEDTPLATHVDYVKLRWRIERDYEELKGELGLNHYEGRGWRGFHHHATLCIAVTDS